MIVRAFKHEITYRIVMSSDSDSQSNYEMSDDTEQALIAHLEEQVDDLHTQVRLMRDTIIKLNKKIKTFESIVKSDLIGKIFKCL